VFAIETSLGQPPAEALSRLNEALIRKAVQGRFATLFYGVLAKDGSLTYTNAGHSPPIVVGPSGIRRLSHGGTIVGVFPEAIYEQETVALSPGEVVVVFSDGVPEAFNPDWEEFGDDRLVEAVRTNADLPPSELLECLLEAVRAFANNAVQSDDVTVMVLRYNNSVES
jgi:sigma-B regulation protein RsbU (phosphoserine phosphatase)